MTSPLDSDRSYRISVKVDLYEDRTLTRKTNESGLFLNGIDNVLSARRRFLVGDRVRGEFDPTVTMPQRYYRDPADGAVKDTTCGRCELIG